MVSKEYQERVHYEQLTQLLTDFYDKKTIQDTTELIEQIQIVEQFSLDSKRILCLFSNVDFFFKYISKNIEKEMGYSPKEIFDGVFPLGFKLLFWNH